MKISKQELQRRILHGETARQIANVYGVKPTDVNRWCDRLGIDKPYRNPPPIPLTEIRDYMEQGITITRLSEIMGVSRRTANNWMMRAAKEKPIGKKRQRDPVKLTDDGAKVLAMAILYQAVQDMKEEKKLTGKLGRRWRDWWCSEMAERLMCILNKPIDPDALIEAIDKEKGGELAKWL